MKIASSDTFCKIFKRVAPPGLKLGFLKLPIIFERAPVQNGLKYFKKWIKTVQNGHFPPTKWKLPIKIRAWGSLLRPWAALSELKYILYLSVITTKEPAYIKLISNIHIWYNWHAQSLICQPTPTLVPVITELEQWILFLTFGIIDPVLFTNYDDLITWDIY